MGMKLERIEEIIDTFKSVKIAVVGDLMLDRYIFGTATRISPEAPIPIVKTTSEKLVPGGAANVLRNLSSIGVQAYACGIIGSDISGKNLTRHCEDAGVDTSGIVRSKNRQTTVKTRVLASNQQLLRIDDEDVHPLSDHEIQVLLTSLEYLIKEEGVKGLIIEDYNKGCISPKMSEALSNLIKKYDLISSLDPHPGNPVRFDKLDLMTPNHKEAFAMAAVYRSKCIVPIDKDKALKNVAKKIHDDYHVKHLLITLGANGMGLFSDLEKPFHIPTVAREVFDVSGAGDTVIALCTSAILAGASIQEAAELANLAAGVVVGHIGTASIELDELISYYKKLS